MGGWGRDRLRRSGVFLFRWVLKKIKRGGKKKKILYDTIVYIYQINALIRVIRVR